MHSPFTPDTFQDSSVKIDSVQQVLGDYTHPVNEEVTEAVLKLNSGEISLCSCTGPLYGEPYCPCHMAKQGLPPSQARVDASQECAKQLFKLRELRELKREVPDADPSA